MSSQLYIHSFVPASRGNGPGLRSVLWVQGCTLGCPGCFNPETHTPTGGQALSVDAVFQLIAAQQKQVQGLTISGGEPLLQPAALLELLQRVRRETTLSTLMFSGFTWQEIGRIKQSEMILSCLDVLLAGRYDQSQRVAAGLLGSANKTIHFLTPRYSARDLAQIPEAEVIISPDGDVIFSGIHPLSWDHPTRDSLE